MNDSANMGNLETREFKESPSDLRAGLTDNDFRLLANSSDQSLGDAERFFPGYHFDKAGSIQFSPAAENRHQLKELCDSGSTGAGEQAASTGSGAAGGDSTASGASAGSDAANLFANLQPLEQQFTQDLQNGAGLPQLEQDVMAELNTFITDLQQMISQIEAQIQGSSAASSVASGSDNPGPAQTTDNSGAGNGATVSGNGTDNAGGSNVIGSGSDGTGNNSTGSDTTGSAVAANQGADSGIGAGTGAQGQTSSVAEVVANDGGGNTLSGTAFFVNSSGLMATDDHVVQGSQGPIQIDLNNGQTLYGNVVEQDSANDLALIQVQNAGNQQFTPVTFGSQSSISSTDTALGYPDAGPLQADSGQYDGTTNFGSLDVTDNTVADNPNRTVLQFTNMMAQEGSSGSPIFNAQGQAVGLVDVGDSYGDIDATPISALQQDIASV